MERMKFDPKKGGGILRHDCVHGSHGISKTPEGGGSQFIPWPVKMDIKNDISVGPFGSEKYPTT